MTFSTLGQSQSFDHKHLEVDNGQMAYLDEGQGPVILLIHGMPTSSYLYRKIIPSLIDAGYRVIVPDALGYGKSDKPKDYTLYNTDLQGKRFLQLMEKLNIPKWTQVCHDAGSLWTWEMLLADHEKIERLVILNSIVYKEGFKPPIRPGKFLSKFISGFYQSPFWGKRMISMTLNSGTSKHKFTKEEKQAYSEPFRTNGKYAIRNFFQEMKSYPALLDRLHTHIKLHPLPTTIIWGQEDPILRGEKQIPLIQRDFKVKPLDVHVIGNAKHFIQEESPEVVVKFMLDFLQKS